MGWGEPSRCSLRPGVPGVAAGTSRSLSHRPQRRPGVCRSSLGSHCGNLGDLSLSFSRLLQEALLSLLLIDWEVLLGQSVPQKLFERCWPHGNLIGLAFRGLASRPSFAAVSSVIVVPSVDFSFLISPMWRLNQINLNVPLCSTSLGVQVPDTRGASVPGSARRSWTCLLS